MPDPVPPARSHRRPPGPASCSGRFLRILPVLLAGSSAFGPGMAAQTLVVVAEDSKPAPAGELTASALINQGRAAFDAGDFSRAEMLFDQLVKDYSGNAEVAPWVDGIRPLLAVCRVKRGAFGDAVTLIEDSLANPELPEAAREELSFWRGICLLRTDRTAAAQEQFGAYFARTDHDRTRRYEAFLLFGTGYIQLGDFAGAADFFADQIPKLPADQSEVAGRARVLLLHSLIQAGRKEESLRMVRESFPRLPEMTQAVSFQLLTLQLGASFLEQGQWYQAIACLNRLWPRERLLGHQRARQAEWQDRRARLKKEGTRREALVFQIDGILTRIERELEQFEKIASYDASRQLRLAQAFMGLQRWREAGALLEHAVTSLPPDALLRGVAETELASWQQIPRWDKVLAAADRYPERFHPAEEAPELPALRLARAEALHGMRRTEEAERAYGGLAQDFPEHRLAARAYFMGGICQMELDRPEAAVVTFRELRQRWPRSPLRGDAVYWEGMALTFQKQWAAARKILAFYLKKHPSGSYAAEAVLERAKCLHHGFQHGSAAGELQAFLKEYPDHPRVAEATLLLGEAQMAEGQMQDGLKTLRKVPESEDRLFEEAQFKIGEGLLKLERPEEVKDHFAAFIASRPRSLRLAEAVLLQGRAAARAGDPEAARTLYWETLLKLGDDPANEGVEDLLLATRRLYPGSGGLGQLMEKLDVLQREARAEGRRTMAVRAQWARGHLLRETSPDQARVVFMQLGDLLDPARHHPRMLADCADARREAGAPRTAKDLYLALRKWHPRAVEKERSSYGLGMLALAAGDTDGALLWFARCGQEAVAGTAGGDARIEQAILLREAGRLEDAMALLEQVTGSRLSHYRQKARALLEMGRCALAARDTAAAARHFQRCYLSGAKFPEYATEAQLQHGLMLEALKKPEEAVAVYRSLLEKRGPVPLDPVSHARKRLEALTKTAAPEGGARP